MTLEDLRLIDGVKGGDTAALGALYERHLDTVRAFARRRAGCLELAEDLVSETFIRVFVRLESFTGGNFEAWLTTIARNLLMDHFRSAPARLELSVEKVHVVETAAGPEHVLIQRVEDQQWKTNLTRMNAALGEVGGDYDTCLRLRFLEGRSIAETAEALSRSQGAVKLLQHRAIKAVRNHLGWDEILPAERAAATNH